MNREEVRELIERFFKEKFGEENPNKFSNHNFLDNRGSTPHSTIDSQLPSSDQKAAMDGAASPDSGNVFATMDDVSSPPALYELSYAVNRNTAGTTTTKITELEGMAGKKIIVIGGIHIRRDTSDPACIHDEKASHLTDDPDYTLHNIVWIYSNGSTWSHHGFGRTEGSNSPSGNTSYVGVLTTAASGTVKVSIVNTDDDPYFRLDVGDGQTEGAYRFEGIALVLNP